MIRTRLIALGLAVLAVIGIGVGASSTSSTEAAWTDQVNFAATATGGIWVNTCVAYDAQNNELEWCAITTFTFHSWGDVGHRSRQYTIKIDAPQNWRHIEFEVDLSTAVDATSGSDGDPDPGSFVWETAAVTFPSGFTPRGDWTCGELPTLRAVGGDWQPNFSFQVVEDGDVHAGATNICEAG